LRRAEQIDKHVAWMKVTKARRLDDTAQDLSTRRTAIDSRPAEQCTAERPIAVL
jgi:hypothetical protein